MKTKMRKASLIIAVIALLSSCSGANNNIVCYTRDTTSGTRDGFFTGIGFSEAKEDNSKLGENFVEVASNGDMISAIKNDVNGIGYISLSTLEDSGVKGLNYEGVVPNKENVLNNTYKLTRNFNYCVREEYTNQDSRDIVSAFIGYMSSVEGKSTIETNGGILPSSSDDKSWSELSLTYPICNKDNQNTTIYVGGSTSVKTIVNALLTEFSSKCGGFKYSYNPTGSADAYKRTNGSEKDGTNYCDLAFASREFNESEPLADNLKGKMCIDAIVAVVNNKNTISEVTASQLKSIYDGTIKTWDQVF